MGTRADFYVGRGITAEWLGSIAFDGYPAGIDEDVLKAATELDYRAAVRKFIDEASSGTRPEQGWPWPWDDSGTTDYAYAFDGGKVHASCFGGKWFDPEDEHAEHHDGTKQAVFPDMRTRKNVAWGHRSGLLILGKA